MTRSNTAGSFWRNNGLSFALFAAFFLFIVGQFLTGYQVFNDELKELHRPTLNYMQYLCSGHFIEATFENWESEFLQMGAYVIFTIFLFQKGSSESKDPDSKSDDGSSTEKPIPNDAPWPVRKGGFALLLYQNSLSIAFILLFLVSIALHAVGGVEVYNLDQAKQGLPSLTALEYAGTSQFWFESFQNWQSEFLSMGLMVVLSIFLRQKGSPESKDVTAAHSDTGD